MKRRSMAMLVAAALVTATTLLLAAFGAVDYEHRSDDEWTRLRRVTRAQTTEMAVALAVPVWNIDRPQIDKILDSQAEVQPIEAIVVQAAGKTHARVRDAKRSFVASDGVFPTAGLLMAEQPIMFEREQIGNVRVYTTPLFVRQLLRSSLMRTVTAILATDVLLIIVVYFLLWRIVLRPLGEIERFAGSVSTGGESAIAVHPGPAAELERLRQSIETMVRLLDERYVKLEQSEERFRTIFDSVKDTILIHDVDGTILDVNARMREMFGYTREEALALDIARLSSGIEPYTQEAGVSRIREALAGNEETFEWHGRHHDGQLFWTEVSLRTATIDGRQRVLVVVRDIQQRKALERELRRRETMAAMGTLVAGVAHEVRNPLFGITALLDAYAPSLDTPELREMADGLREQAGRLTQLTRELLDYGMPVTITLVPGSLGSLVDEAIAGRAPAAARARLTVRNAIERSLPDTPMDRARMRQVFDNLLDNALHHSRSTVTVAAREVVQDGRSWIECTVEDDGKGFEPADLDRVFEPFFTRRERGIGLGMSVVQHIVEEHAGRVTAANRAQGGAIITVRLPVAR